MCEIHTGAKKKPAWLGGLKSSGEREGRDRSGAVQVCLLVERRAADLVVFQDTARIADLEGGDLLAVFEGDDDGLVGGVGAGGGKQSGDQQALDQFGRRHFEVLGDSRFVLMPLYGGGPALLVEELPLIPVKNSRHCSFGLDVRPSNLFTLRIALMQPARLLVSQGAPYIPCEASKSETRGIGISR